MIECGDCSGDPGEHGHVLSVDQLPARARCTDCGVRYETALPLQGRYVEHCPLCGARAAVVALVPDPPRVVAPDVAAKLG